MASVKRADTRRVSGIVLVDKPGGLTSNRVLQRVKRMFRAEKAGHTGTLDPLATGMLPICLGSATRVSGLMLDASKRYRVIAGFGVATDTGDAEGSIIERRDADAPSPGKLTAAVEGLRGPIMQTPPMYSALKHGGRPLYELARKGQSIERAPRPVEIFELAVEAVDWPSVTLFVHCSKGTYIRTLVGDLATALGTCGHVQALRRLAVGAFNESQMLAIETLEKAAEEGLQSLDRLLLPIDAALQGRPVVNVNAADALALRQGRRIVIEAAAQAPSVRVYDPDGTLVGMGELSGAGELRPSCIFPV